MCILRSPWGRSNTVISPLSSVAIRSPAQQHQEFPEWCPFSVLCWPSVTRLQCSNGKWFIRHLMAASGHLISFLQTRKKIFWAKSSIEVWWWYDRIMTERSWVRSSESTNSMFIRRWHRIFARKLRKRVYMMRHEQELNKEGNQTN